MASLRSVLVSIAITGCTHGLDCGQQGSWIMADMHDGDQKRVSLVFGDYSHGLKLSITPYNNTQTWKVLTPWNNLYCNASVDFRVPGKPNPPPVALTLTYFAGNGGKGQTRQDFAVFTDPTASLAPSSMPLNTWVGISGAGSSGDFRAM